MKTLLHNKSKRFYEMIFSQQSELTQGEKQDVIDDFNGGEKGKEIDAKIKMISATFGVLQAAVSGVAFQYYQDFHNSESDNGQNTSDFFLHNKEFVNRNSGFLVGISVCFVAEELL